MAVTKETYQAYFTILKEELVPALGCTEPIAMLMPVQKQEKF